MLKSMRKSKNRYFYHIFVSPGDAPGAITNYPLTCAYLTITFSEIERYICEKSSFYHTLLHSTPPLGGFLLEYHHPIWCGKTRMVGLPDGEKKLSISITV